MSKTKNGDALRDHNGVVIYKVGDEVHIAGHVPRYILIVCLPLIKHCFCTNENISLKKFHG